MKIWRTRDGEWIEGKEFLKRWGKGIEGVTPFQQSKSQLLFTWITVIGILCGIGISIYAYKTLWWLVIVLIAALGNTIVALIGLYQRYKQLKRIDETFKEVNNGF